MAEITLYGYQGSGSAAIEAALVWARLPYRLVNAASWDSESELEALRRVNPLLQIPALQWEDGSVMSESAAILVELALRHPASGLLPAEPVARARCIRGLVYVAANCYAMIGIIDYPDRVVGEADDALAERVRAASKRRLHELWGRFADQFDDGRPYLGGAAPDALDLLATVVSKWSGTRAHLQAERPGFLALLRRVEQHPVLAPVFERHWPAQR